MIPATWSTYSTDPCIALGIIAPSTTMDIIDNSSFFSLQMITRIQRTNYQDTIPLSPSLVSANSSSVFPEYIISNTATISEKVSSFLLQQQERSRKLEDFLSMVVQRDEVKQETASLALQAWRTMRTSVSGTLLIPDAGIGPDGEVLLVWKKDEHHFELEILPEGPVELFYINHLSNDMWEKEYHIGDNFPNEVTSQLTPFLFYE